MNAPSALSSLYFAAPAPSSPQAVEQQQQQQQAPASKPKANSTVTILPAPGTSSANTPSVSASPSALAEPPAMPTTPAIDGYSTPTSKSQTQTQTLIPSPTSVTVTGKRKRPDEDEHEDEEHELTSFLAPTPSKRKGSSDFLRKGQWTNTEERLARLLIEAFEDGYLPIYTGIRLRGYLAVQLQCDPMRVSKKLCAGTIDGKPVPKNYGQKKFKLRKKPFWDCDEADDRIAELERLTKALWSEARMKKPAFLTLSTTRNVSKRRGAGDDDDSASSPPSPAKGRAPSSTPRSKKQKVFPIIYLNLSKKFKHYSVRGLDSSSSSGSEPASPSNDSDSDSEPVRLDGESLQAAYDLLTLCSPRGGSKSKSKKRASKKAKGKAAKDASNTDVSSEDASTKEPPVEDKSGADKSNGDKSEEQKPMRDETSQDIPTDATPSKDISVEDAPAAEVSKTDIPSADDVDMDLPSSSNEAESTDPVREPQPLEDACIKDVSSSST